MRVIAEIIANCTVSVPNSAPSDLDLLSASMDDLAREIGEMEPDDPVRAVRLKELYTFTELSKFLKSRVRLSTRKWMRSANDGTQSSEETNEFYRGWSNLRGTNSHTNRHAY